MRQILAENQGGTFTEALIDDHHEAGGAVLRALSR